jgi:branched-chain amino acid transport system substrate-binding protein
MVDRNNGDEGAKKYGRREMLKKMAFAGAAGATSWMFSPLLAESAFAGQGGEHKFFAIENNSELNFGVFLPTSGPFTITTVPWTAAIRYAIEERNEAGGLKIGGKSFKVKAPLYDTGYAAAPSLRATRKFVSNGGHYVGGLVSVEGPQAVLGVNERAKLLVVLAITGADVALTYNKLRVFDNALAQAVGPVKAQFAYKHLGLRRIATIELKNTWGKDYQESFAKEFERLGGKVVARDYMLVTQTDYTGIISSWKSKNPDSFYVIIGDGPGTKICRQLDALGFTDQPILTEGAWDPNSYKDVGKDFIQRCYYMAEYPYSHWSKKNSEFAERLYKEHQLYLTNWFWDGYDSTRMVLDAMELAGSTYPEAVIKALPEAIAKGRDKWMIKAKGAVTTEKKGIYVKVPMWMSQFKPVDTYFLKEACLKPVGISAYEGVPGWMPGAWKGYRQSPKDIEPATSTQLERLFKT